MRWIRKDFLVTQTSIYVGSLVNNAGKSRHASHAPPGQLSQSETHRSEKGVLPHSVDCDILLAPRHCLTIPDMQTFDNKFAMRRWANLAITAAAVMLASCGGSGSDDSPAPPGQTPQNVAPTLTGNPQTSATVGVAYSFQPTAQDPEGAALAFTIQNKPAWATFSTVTGQLSGTPSSAGTASNIVISVSDGTSTTSLATFSLTVNPPVATTGTAQLSWTAPTLNSDGSSLSDLAGFRVYYGASASAMNSSVDVPGASARTYTVANLAYGTWYFSMTAYSTNGVESTLSNPVSLSIQ